MADQVGRSGPGALESSRYAKEFYFNFILSLTGWGKTLWVKLCALIYLIKTDFCGQNRLLANKGGSSRTNQKATVAI